MNSSYLIASTAATSKRNMGGRRPKNASNLTPEEEAKRKLRRERNKAAAARCRKRRLDQTNELADKVSVLESEKQKLQLEIQDLQTQKEDLEYLLQSHRTQCKFPMTSLDALFDRKPIKERVHSTIHCIDKIKEEIVDSPIEDENEMVLLPPPQKRLLLSAANPVIGSSSTANSTIGKPSRPCSLNVPFTTPPNIADMGVMITTPSAGVSLNFDSLMDGGTGLTPGIFDNL